MEQILIVEDDRYLSDGLSLALKDKTNNVLQSNTLANARQLLKHEPVSLVLLDINLPDGSGLDLLQEIKKTSDTAVILLTANDTEMDVVLGLENGADDYITKPFSLAILRARVQAQLRQMQKKSPLIFTIDAYNFDFDHMEFSYKGQPVELSKTEQKLLRVLVENRGVTLTRETLMEYIWSEGYEYVDENTLSVCIKRLRDKLDAANYIQTVYGLGYVWKVK